MSPDEEDKTAPKPPAEQVVKSEIKEKDTTPPASFRKDNFLDFSLNTNGATELQSNQSVQKPDVSTPIINNTDSDD